MRLHRFIAEVDLRPGTLRIDDSALLHQWSAVLRLREGDVLVLCDGKGSEANAVIAKLEKKSAIVTIVEVRSVEREPTRHVTLCAAVIKRENFEWIVGKATEAGVSEIIPIISARTVKTGLKMERLRAIAKEAVEQCGRGIVPVLHEPMEFEEAMGKMKEKKNILFHVDDCHAEPCRSILRQASSSGDRQDDNSGAITIWVGPEGGWTDEEVQLAKNAGADIRSLGMLTLRAETAAIIATYLATQRHSID